MDSMDYVGIANVFKKKSCTIDGKNFEYYKMIDSVFGVYYNFRKNDKCFIVLSGNFSGETISLDSSKYSISDFKTLNELCEENGHSYNYEKFINKYKDCINQYYTLDSNKHLFLKINDKEIIRQIEYSDKDYDNSILTNKTPISQMYSEIKKTIISQDDQIMQILTSIFKNQQVINSSLNPDMKAKLKENIIIYGPTGTGKTEILKRIASIYKVPIVIEDATSFSEIGYEGRNITDMFKDLYLAAGKNKEIAEKGILVIDEFDKLAEKSGNSKDHVSRIGVQRSLLKLLDGSTFYFNDITFDTSKLTIVALGAFTDIVKDDDYFKVTSNDFINYGIMRELMGRFSKLIAMNPLKREDIKKILLESDFSPLNTYKKLFEMLQVQFEFRDDFIEYIADLAIAKKSGARSLKTVFDDCISSALFRIFAGEYSGITLVKPDIENEKPYVLTKTK